MSFIEFSSAEDMFNWMAQRTDEANAGLAPEQTRVGYSDTWIRFDHLDQFGVICGRVATLEEAVPPQGPDDAPGEAEAERARAVENHERGYLTGMAYSQVEPDGEWGDTHRANLWPLEPDLFEALRAVGWRHEDLALADKIRVSIVFEQWRQHELALIAQQRAALAVERQALRDAED